MSKKLSELNEEIQKLKSEEEMIDKVFKNFVNKHNNQNK